MDWRPLPAHDEDEAIDSGFRQEDQMSNENRPPNWLTPTVSVVGAAIAVLAIRLTMVYLLGSGHKSAKNCFIKEGSTATDVQFDEHGASCQICVGIALDTKAMTAEGRSLSEIRTFIDETYG